MFRNGRFTGAAAAAACALFASLPAMRVAGQEAAPERVVAPAVVKAGEPVEPLGAYLVNDPTRGYGIFAETMLRQTQAVAKMDPDA